MFRTGSGVTVPDPGHLHQDILTIAFGGLGSYLRAQFYMMKKESFLHVIADFFAGKRNIN